MRNNEITNRHSNSMYFIKIFPNNTLWTNVILTSTDLKSLITIKAWSFYGVKNSSSQTCEIQLHEIRQLLPCPSSMERNFRVPTCTTLIKACNKGTSRMPFSRGVMVCVIATNHNIGFNLFNRRKNKKDTFNENRGIKQL